MGLKGTLWILCAFAIKGYWTAQHFEATPSDIEVNPNESVTLTCKVRNRRGECIWLRNGYALGKIQDVYIFEREPANGDCSLIIKSANLKNDDDNYQCQVTQASREDEALTSPLAKLTVREKPHPPRIEFKANLVQENFTTRDGEQQRLHCLSRKGNPPAVLKWFIDKEEITSSSKQINSSDPEKEKTWQADSILNYTFTKEHNGKTIRCVAIHPSYVTKSEEVAARLAVQYPPTIQLLGPSYYDDIEEEKSLSLKCVADGNPPANIIWKKSGNTGIFSLQDEIRFASIKRSDSGEYTCEAKNDLGYSEQLRITIDVKYKPRITKILPEGRTTETLYSSAKLVCEAEGNPPPKYMWLKKVGNNAWREREPNATFYIHNVTYSYQGKYICEASNVIGGIEYKVQSSEVTLDVIGAPQVLTDKTQNPQRVVVEKDEDASINVLFCADPEPQRIFWEWGSLQLDSGSDHVRYVAEPVMRHRELDDCYDAKLIVQKVEGSDSRKYTLTIINEKGRESYVIALEVREPVAMSVVVGIIVGCIILLVIIILVVLYLLKSEKMCFRRKKGFNPETDSDAESARSGEQLHNGRADGHDGAIPPDAIYSAPKTRKDDIDHNQLTDKNENRNKDGIVYADLDLPLSNINGKPKPAPRRPVERTEYAEIQFQSTSDEQAHL